MSFLKDLLGEIGVPKVEKKLTGIESRYITNPFEKRLPIEPVDPDEAYREECRKRMADIFDITPQEDARRRR